jgi:hypothetical protein
VNRRALLAIPLLLLLAGCAPQGGSSISAQCDDSMKTTAAVPFSESNAVQLEKTLTACTSVAEWKAALQKYPAVGAVPEITDAEVPLYLKIACSQLPDGGTSNAVCSEATSSGFIK